MDQKKTGLFIAKKRKEKSFTQQQLADRLGISSKTVSKWETGNGLPEVSLMLPLCEELGISVNELLSGEALCGSYEKKAEENLIGFIREKESDRRKGRKAVGLLAVSAAVSVVFWLILFADSNVYQLGQRPTPLTLCYLTVGFLAIFAAVTVCSCGILKRSAAAVFTALSAASLACLLVCMGRQTAWLMLPAAVCMAAAAVLGILCMCKNKIKPIEKTKYPPTA